MATTKKNKSAGLKTTKKSVTPLKTGNGSANTSTGLMTTNQNGVTPGNTSSALTAVTPTMIKTLSFNTADTTIADTEKTMVAIKIEQSANSIKPDGNGKVQAVITLKDALAEDVDARYKAADKLTVSVELMIEGRSCMLSKGIYSASTDRKTITITQLVPPKKFRLDLFGTIGIKNPAKASDPAAKTAEINVKVGNDNPGDDWIIQTTANPETGSDSYVNVGDMIAWMKGQTDMPSGESTDVSIPGNEDSAEQINDYFIDIKELKLNISQKTFRTNLISRPNQDPLKITNSIDLSNLGFKLSYDYDDAQVKKAYDIEAEDAEVVVD